MSGTTSPAVNPRRIVAILRTHPRRWIAPTVVLTVLAVGYALVRRPTWEASQAMLIREEAGANSRVPGRFVDARDMKTAQETVLELAGSRNVIRAALVEVGPPDGSERPGPWPTRKDVAHTRKSVKVTAPNGAEFGSTEVFYLHVKDHDRLRATALTTALCNQLESRLKRLRDRKSQSLIDELTRTVELARADLDDVTRRLSAIEKEVGGDLAELRILNESAGGESNLRMTLTQIRNELRQADANRQANRQLHQLLVEARKDPDQLVATPNRLLQAQPALRQLKDGLVDAELRTSQLLGTMSEAHPKVREALAAEREIRSHLHQELEIAVRGLEVDLQFSQTRIDSLNARLADMNRRMSRVAGLRARYGNLSAESRERSETLAKAQTELADARASLAGAHSASVITRLDGPVVGAYPVGPRRSAIVSAGMLGGLLVGLGIVFLTVPSGSPVRDESEATTGQTATPERAPAAGDQSNGKKPSRRPRRLSLKDALRRIAQDTPTWN